MSELRLAGNMETLVKEVVASLQDRGLTVGFAESCTGGLLSANLAKLSGVSSVYQGSVVSYANSVKVGVLGVPESALSVYGAVSEPVARFMAQGAREQLASDWSISITGVAGPGGGSPEKPVGMVCFGVSGPGVDYALTKRFEEKGREAIQKASANFALELLKKELS